MAIGKRRTKWFEWHLNCMSHDTAQSFSECSQHSTETTQHNVQYCTTTSKKGENPTCAVPKSIHKTEHIRTSIKKKKQFAFVPHTACAFMHLYLYESIRTQYSGRRINFIFVPEIRVCVSAGVTLFSICSIRTRITTSQPHRIDFIQFAIRSKSIWKSGCLAMRNDLVEYVGLPFYQFAIACDSQHTRWNVDRNRW